MAKKNNTETSSNKKMADLEKDTEDSAGQFLTTNQGVKVNDNQNSLKAGERGGTLLEDFILREKIMHFDHERIPERIVHARGSAAHGYFQVYKSMVQYTKAAFLQDPSAKIPVFVRFSTVAGNRGSSDLARDARGFATKFYTQEGNYDLVGNNIPVFFIQDAIKFPDLVHAFKPEPNNEMPQAATAHDNFWDFISLMPESIHMIMWAMSDRGIPRSYRMMEGFGVHTFRFINASGKGSFVKFHWKPVLGVHSVAWDEALKISGYNSDFHRQDLWDAIENGNYPEYELGVQIVPEKDEFKFDFDLLDPTKIIPEEVVPVQLIGKMILNRNPDNFFAETEQAAFHPGHLVPGIDFTNDPLLQGRLFSYSDTQLSRLGNANFHELPINRSINTIHNNQRDGHGRQQINKGRVNYDPNSLAGGCPFQAKATEGGFTSYAEKIDGKKIRARSESFHDHFSQARLFYVSQAPYEQRHIINALRFELGKVVNDHVKTRVLGLLTQVDENLAAEVAAGLGMQVPKKPVQPVNASFGADTNPKKVQPKFVKQAVEKSPALSMAHSRKDTIQSRVVAILSANGVDENALTSLENILKSKGAMAKVIAPEGNMIKSSKGNNISVDHSFLTCASVLFDAVFVPGGSKSIDILMNNSDAIHFVNQAYKHCKAIGATGEGVDFIQSTFVGKKLAESMGANSTAGEGVIINNGDDVSKTVNDFIKAVAQHRFWQREMISTLPA
jgi:catalase